MQAKTQGRDRPSFVLLTCLLTGYIVLAIGQFRFSSIINQLYFSA
ncbi:MULTISPECIES: hypothetical protein [unclassified Microcoleus]